MKHFSLSIAVLVALAPCLAAATAHAHPVTVDGIDDEWMTSRMASYANLGMVVRNASREGEYVWRDLSDDSRTDLFSPDLGADLRVVRVTGDTEGLGLVVMTASSAPDPQVQLQFAIDLDRVNGSGEPWMAGSSDTRVAADAEWEFLIQTAFTSGGEARVLDAGLAPVATVSAIAAGDTIELYLPWASIGLPGPPSTPVRFSLCSFRADETDAVIDVGGASVSDALDCVTTYGNPQGSAPYPVTWDEVLDQTVDYYFDVYFDQTGEVYPPLVVQSFASNNPLGAGGGEFIVLRNLSPGKIALGAFKLGDEEAPDASEGMMLFPAGAAIDPDATYVVAQNGNDFAAAFGWAPDAELAGGTAAPDMTPYAAWAGGSLGLTNTGDHLLVLDQSDTILDLVVFGTVSYPGIVTLDPAPGSGQVFARSSMPEDRDDCSIDFGLVGFDECAGPGDCAECSECVGTSCLSVPDETACADDDPCTLGDWCVSGSCTGTPKDCSSESDACNDAVCNPISGDCVKSAANQDGECDDQDPCTEEDLCKSGVCTGTLEVSCDDGNACTLDLCLPATGLCSNTDITGCCRDQGDCDDADPCTLDTCSGSGGTCDHDPIANCPSVDAGTAEDAAIGDAQVDIPTDASAGDAEGEAPGNSDAASGEPSADEPVPADGGDSRAEDAIGQAADGVNGSVSASDSGCGCAVIGRGADASGLAGLAPLIGLFWLACLRRARRRSPEVVRGKDSVKRALFLVFILAGFGSSLIPVTASAHPVTVDGIGDEWMTSRMAEHYNLGIVVRDALFRGEYVWLDAPDDGRTDLNSPELGADILVLRVTGDAGGMGMVIKTASTSDDPQVQIQVAIDLDRVNGSGEGWMAGLSETTVSADAEWEYLVQTLFTSGGEAQVLDTTFTPVDTISADAVTDTIELYVPWGSIGLVGPPSTPIRFSVCSFRADVDDTVIDIGDPISDALDCVTHYGDPQSILSPYPNTWDDLSDGTVDYYFDLYFDPEGEVYAPLVVQSFAANNSSGGEFYILRNVSPGTIYLDAFKLGDEEDPDSGEGMLLFPAGEAIDPDATYVVAQNGSSFNSVFGWMPDAELAGSTAAPDMSAYAVWATGPLALNNTGDHLIVLDQSDTILDLVVYDAETYSGIGALSPAPGPGLVFARNSVPNDTDNCNVNFELVGFSECTEQGDCAACRSCVGSSCVSKPEESACTDGDPCTLNDQCISGSCTGAPKDCSSQDDTCNDGVCSAGDGSCIKSPVNQDGDCDDQSLCTTGEACKSGVCTATSTVDCGDADACTLDLCLPATGLCSNTDIADCCHDEGDCDDGDPCTLDTCSDSGGTCGHDPVANCPSVDAGAAEDASIEDASLADAELGDSALTDAALADAQLDGPTDASAGDAEDEVPGASDAALRDASTDSPAPTAGSGGQAEVEDAGEQVADSAGGPDSGCGCAVVGTKKAVSDHRALPPLILLFCLVLLRRAGRRREFF